MTGVFSKRGAPLLALLLLAAFLLQACAVITPGGEDTAGKKEKTVAITLYDGEEARSYEVTVGKQAAIGECIKHGYYSMGYYTAPEGGERYFSADGKSLSEWSESFPTVFYVQYAPIGDFSCTKSFLDNEIHTLSYYTHARINTVGELGNALKGNLDKTIRVKLSFIASDTSGDEDWVIYYKNTQSYNEGNLISKAIAAKYHGFEIDVGSSYQSFSHISYIPASEIYAGEALVAFFNRGATFGDGKIKNIVFELSFQ